MSLSVRQTPVEWRTHAMSALSRAIMRTVGGQHRDGIEALANSRAPKKGTPEYTYWLKARIISNTRKQCIGIVDDRVINLIAQRLSGMDGPTTNARYERIIREANTRFEDWLPPAEIAKFLGLDLTVTETVTTGTPTPSIPSGGSPVSSPIAPQSPVAPPEMDLTVPRDSWPEIIRKTTGHLLAYGPPGTGKSFEFNQYAVAYADWKTDDLLKAGLLAAGQRVEHEEVNCTRQTSAAGWIGHWIDTKTGFQWQDGPIARAMKNGVPVVINDVHLCSDDLFDLLFFVLDTRPGAKMSLNSGEHLRPQPGFRALLSGNGIPEQFLDEPILDRLLVKFLIDVPSEAQLKILDRDVRPMCRIWYKAAAEKHVDPKFTFRTCMYFCQLRRELGDPFVAARLACGDEQKARAFLEPLLVK